jgi:hypothetical protein
VSSIYNPESAGKERDRLMKIVALAIREFSQQSESGDKSRDLVAFISLALARISDTVEKSVAAWEKRDYWVKADKFRLEWSWSSQYSEKLKQAVLHDDWQNVFLISSQIAQKLMRVRVSARLHLKEPWKGAWDELKAKQ